MLLPLLRTYLRPYRGAIALVVVFQLVQTLATLYLPGLNADVIDQGDGAPVGTQVGAQQRQQHGTSGCR